MLHTIVWMTLMLLIICLRFSFSLLKYSSLNIPFSVSGLNTISNSIWVLCSKTFSFSIWLLKSINFCDFPSSPIMVFIFRFLHNALMVEKDLFSFSTLLLICSLFCFFIIPYFWSFGKCFIKFLQLFLCDFITFLQMRSTFSPLYYSLRPYFSHPTFSATQ